MKLRKIMENFSGLHESSDHCNREGNSPCKFKGYLLTKEELKQIFNDAREGMLIDDNYKISTFNEWLKEQEGEDENQTQKTAS